MASTLLITFAAMRPVKLPDIARVSVLLEVRSRLVLVIFVGIKLSAVLLVNSISNTKTTCGARVKSNSAGMSGKGRNAWPASAEEVVPESFLANT